MSKTVKIKTVKVGQNFACAAKVVAGNNRELHRTRDFPHGMDSNAFRAARDWAEERGYKVAE